MKQTFLLAILIISVSSAFCQKEADDLFKKGNKFYKDKSYQKAIEYYTYSLDLDPVADVYYNRAQCYFKLMDSCNFCKDLIHASWLGDKESGKLYSSKCEIRDTIHESADTIFEEFPGYAYSIQSRSICNTDSIYSYRNSKGENIESAWIKMPEFPGGEMKRNIFLADNINYPINAANNGIQGVVYVSFVIEVDGRVTDIKLLKGPGGGLNEEAMRVVRLMPRWKPGSRRNIPIKFTFNMPVYFKLQG